ncbi:MAG: AsmA family protein, partial [Acidobacteria bacterium]|nr:AsmA family protein [Acidobacteriota bacterium]
MNRSPHIPGTRRRTWLRRFAIAFFVWLVAHLILVLLVSTSRVQRALAARITAAFGRPVEVGNFAISVLEGPRLVAHYVTVSEDPRFGREHFLRAERLTAAIRWTALLRGRLEFDTVSFTRPSLNLVRNADGSWNLESWMPAPSASRGTPASPMPRQTLLTRINIDTGRINFKRGVDKHPFAFTNVDGFVERDSSGHWRVDLEATVMRAGVTVQEPGTLRLRGSIGSAASRLQPAELALTWQEASLSDALRLARGHDYGVRGNFELDVSASVAPSRNPGAREPAVWSLQGNLRLRDVHGWNLAQRPEDPDVNLLVEAKWTPQRARVEFSRILLDAPRSNIRASGFLQWAQPQASDFRILSTGISLNDLLDWYRAFRPGVAPDLSIEGNAGLDADLGGWPVGVHRAALASDGAQMKIPGLSDPLRLDRAVLRWTPAKMELLPIQFTLVSAAAPAARTASGRAFRLSLNGAGTPRANGNCAALLCADFKLSLAGQMDRFQDFLAVTRAFGWPLDAGWAVDGPASFSVIGEGRLFPFAVDSHGSVRFAGTRLLPPFLNQPVLFKDALFAWSPAPGERRLTLINSAVFGSRWTGSIFSRNRGPWEFSLAADRIEIGAVNQWLNPARQQGLFQRLISSAATRRGSVEYEDQLGRLRARGQVRVDHLTLAPISLRKLRGALELDGRKIKLSDAQADFYGGAVRGSFRAELAVEPKYDVQAKFERVNLAALTTATATLKNLFSGTAAGELSLSTRGIGRENLLRALDAQAAFDFRDAQFRGLDLAESVRVGAARPGTS